MKITFLLPRVNMSGGLRVITLYAQAMADRGHEVKLISVIRPGPTIIGQIKSLLRGQGLQSWQEHFPSYLDGTDLDHEVLDGFRIKNRHVPPADVVVATWWETALWAQGFASDKGRHAYFMQDYGAAGQEIDKISETWKLPVHFITLTSALARMIRSHNPTAPIDVVPNAVEATLFHAPARAKRQKPTVGLAFRDVHSKGMDIAFDAIARARRTIPDLQVVAYGINAPKGTLLTGPGATFHRAPADTELADIYAACDAWLFPSRQEGFGLPILEAMACRTPVISTPVGAAPDIVTPQRGHLMRSEDPADMATGIEAILGLSDPDWQQMSQACLDATQSYTWEDAADLFEASLKAAKNTT